MVHSRALDGALKRSAQKKCTCTSIYYLQATLERLHVQSTFVLLNGLPADLHIIGTFLVQYLHLVGYSRKKPREAQKDHIIWTPARRRSVKVTGHAAKPLTCTSYEYGGAVVCLCITACE